MSGVPQDTVVRRAAAFSFLILTATLAGCGSSSGDGASKGSPTVSADVANSAAPVTTPASTPKLTAAQRHAANRKAARLKKIAEQQVAKSVPVVTDDPETPKSIQKASPKDERPSQINGDIDKTKAALSKAGMTATKVQVSGGDAKAIQVANTTIVFYSSERKAAQYASTFSMALAANPQYGRLARTANRIYLLSTADKLSDSEKAAYKRVRSIVDGAL